MTLISWFHVRMFISLSLSLYRKKTFARKPYIHAIHCLLEFSSAGNLLIADVRTLFIFISARFQPALFPKLLDLYTAFFTNIQPLRLNPATLNLPSCNMHFEYFLFCALIAQLFLYIHKIFDFDFDCEILEPSAVFFNQLFPTPQQRKWMVVNKVYVCTLYMYACTMMITIIIINNGFQAVRLISMWVIWGGVGWIRLINM